MLAAPPPRLRRLVSALAVSVGVLGLLAAAPPVAAASGSGAPLSPADLALADHLTPGDQGPAVELLQVTLNDYGAGLTLTGSFDQATLDAVSKFAAEEGISGSSFFELIGLGFTSIAPALLPGQSSVEVGALQRALSRAGFAVTASGTFDAATKSAVLAFEKAHGLPPSPSISLWQVESLLPVPTLSTTPPPTSTVAPSSVRLAIAEVTEGLLGYPYVWGGSEPTGFDCSGLVEYVFARVAHLDLPHSSSAQFTMGQSVGIAQLQPGDLVFFDTDGPGATHVGIYTGYGQFISATTPSGGVQWGSIWSTYWSQHYVGARSILPSGSV